MEDQALELKMIPPTHSLSVLLTARFSHGSDLRIFAQSFLDVLSCLMFFLIRFIRLGKADCVYTKKLREESDRVVKLKGKG